jgi:hypothetical protein
MACCPEHLQQQHGENSRSPAAPRAPIEKNGLLPSAWCLVGSVDATRPAARPLLAFQQFGAGALYTALTRRQLLRVLDPADELVPTKRGQAVPERKELGD